MKKTYRHMWGVSLLVYLLLTMLGGVNAKAASTTFEFSGPAEALESLEVWYQYTMDLTPEIKDKKLTVEYTGQASYDFSVPDTYTITIEAPAGLTPGVDYLITDNGSSFGFYSVGVILTDSCDGTVFKVKIPGGEDEEPTEMAPATMLLPAVDANGEISEDIFGTTVAITYDFQTLSMLSEKYVPATIVNPDGDEFLVTGVLIPYDASIAGNSFNSDEIPEGNVIVSFNITKAAMPGLPNNFDVLIGEYVMTVQAGCVANEAGETNPEQTFKFTVTESSATPTEVTFDFSGDAEGMETLMIIDYTLYAYIQDEIQDNQLKVSFENGYNTYAFTVASEYEIEIVPPADLIENVDYVLHPGMLDANMGIYGVILDLTEGAAGATFKVNISPIIFDNVNNIEEQLSDVKIVYSLTGSEILRTQNREELNKLASGMYIINGKKMMIRH